jgi:hypothetical protein
VKERKDSIARGESWNGQNARMHDEYLSERASESSSRAMTMRRCDEAAMNEMLMMRSDDEISDDEMM